MNPLELIPGFGSIITLFSQIAEAAKQAKEKSDMEKLNEVSDGNVLEMTMKGLGTPEQLPLVDPRELE